MATRVQRKANDDSSLFYEFDLHLPSRTIYCGNSRSDDGENDDAASAELMVKGMHLLNQTEGNINVLINHWGGDEYHYLAVYDAIATSPHKVIATVYGAAFSMGSWILQAADQRILAPSATLLLHYGSWDLVVDDASEDRVSSLANEGNRLRRLMEQTYLRRIHEKNPAFSEADLKRYLHAESYIPAQQAVELGLADEVIK